MKMTLANRISLACGTLLAFSFALGGVLIYDAGRLSSAVRSVAVVSLPQTIALQQLTQSASDSERAMLRHLLADTADLQSQFENDLARSESQFQAQFRECEASLADASERAQFEHIGSAHDDVMREWSSVILPLSREHSKEVFPRWVSEMMPKIHTEEETLQAPVDYNRRTASGAAEAATAAGDSARWWSIVLLVLAVAGGGGIGFAIIRSTNNVLVRVVTDLSRGAEQVSSAAGQIASSSQSLAQGTAEQAASLEETSASAEEMTSMTRKNAENSEDCAKLMAAVDSRINEANETLQEMVVSMEQIVASSDKISKIIKVIEEIAFQTNILALNAAVEAARAGEAGMGFAVVADEVRNLAQRSSQAAKDTAILIEESISKSNGGTAKVARVAEVIQAITESANKVKLLVDEVNVGSREQARGMAQISKSVTEIERVTQTAAANSEETASASEELSAQAETMRGLVESVRQLAGCALAASGQAARKRPQERPAVALRRAATARQAVAPAGAVAGKTSRELIPLEEDFKEF
jgi:methyl-accepting chemotaxis protein